jgi:glycine/D-amino acid oxidase-like deaminating enzyme
MFDVSGYAQVSEAILMDEPMEEFAQLIAMWVRFHDARPDVGLAWFLQHYKDGKLLAAAPVEPPVLSRAAIDEMITRQLPEPPLSLSHAHNNWLHARAAAQALADAILESLSQEAGQ